MHTNQEILVSTFTEQKHILETNIHTKTISHCCYLVFVAGIFSFYFYYRILITLLGTMLIPSGIYSKIGEFSSLSQI